MCIGVAVDERQPVFADDDGAKALHKAVDAVIDLWVDVVWATGEDDDRQLVDAGVLDRLVGEGLELVVVAALRCVGSVEGFADLAAVCAETLGEVLGELLFHEFFIVDAVETEEVFLLVDLADVGLDDLRIIGDDWAVVVVVADLLVEIVAEAWVENKINVLLQQPFNVAVDELGRIADGVRRDGVLPFCEELLRAER